VMGIDLVREQLRIAAGEPLTWSQEAVRPRGAALECRIYAEDPSNDFFPSPGLITHHREPAGPGVRLDGGVYEGWRVPLEYDPLLAKLVVWGSDRTEAVARMKRALLEYEIIGIETTIPFFRRILDHPDFTAGRIDTGFIDRVLSQGWFSEEEPCEEAELAALVTSALEAARQPATPAPAVFNQSAWKNAGREALLNRWPSRTRRRE
jgi:acetyl-CoA carboxylase biotin carboxylase subunit